MTAALEADACWWDDQQHPINADGEEGRQELARACAEIWLASIRVYYSDASAALRGKSAHNDGGEALADLRGDRRLLGRLCRPLDACPQRVGDAMERGLELGLRFDASAMSRPVPEVHDDYRLGAWREKQKRRGKPVPITLK
ncbi:hypothetical protein [Halomonas sp. PGE1]|uniref:hypothetical protein n=1 Tax=Halomonas sp. PGE1 TaxID=2730360 RepID=UPI0014756E37|nr:hypothetical protein [Halomonas sp. PGE1]QJQ98922.1 hypothetical protein HIR79_09600 [Halomonas sp. PGE1]